MQKPFRDTLVGFFMIIGFITFAFLSFQVSGLSHSFSQATYPVYASFDNIGDLKIRAPVTIAGVKIGEVTQIDLDPKSLRAKIEMQINSEQNHIPSGTSAQILTQGVLGANYIGLIPTLSMDESSQASPYLVAGNTITETQSALILENLISQFIYNSKKE